MSKTKLFAVITGTTDEQYKYLAKPSIGNSNEIVAYDLKKQGLSVGQEVGILQCFPNNSPSAGWAAFPLTFDYESIIEVEKSQKNQVADQSPAQAVLYWLCSKANKLRTIYHIGTVQQVLSGLLVVRDSTSNSNVTMTVSDDLSAGSFVVNDVVVIRKHPKPLGEVIGWWLAMPRSYIPPAFVPQTIELYEDWVYFGDDAITVDLVPGTGEAPFSWSLFPDGDCNEITGKAAFNSSGLVSLSTLGMTATPQGGGTSCKLDGVLGFPSYAGPGVSSYVDKGGDTCRPKITVTDKRNNSATIDVLVHGRYLATHYSGLSGTQIPGFPNTIANLKVGINTNANHLSETVGVRMHPSLSPAGGHVFSLTDITQPGLYGKLWNLVSREGEPFPPLVGDVYEITLTAASDPASLFDITFLTGENPLWEEQP